MTLCTGNCTCHTSTATSIVLSDNVMRIHALVVSLLSTLIVNILSASLRMQYCGCILVPAPTFFCSLWSICRPLSAAARCSPQPRTCSPLFFWSFIYRTDRTILNQSARCYGRNCHTFDGFCIVSDRSTYKRMTPVFFLVRINVYFLFSSVFFLFFSSIIRNE